MQPLMCRGGYPMPICKGKHEIVAIIATVSDPTAASRINIIDSDDFKIVTDGLDLQYKDNRRTIFDMRGLANADASIGIVFPEPLKTTRGISLNSLSTNLKAGMIFVYVR